MLLDTFDDAELTIIAGGATAQSTMWESWRNARMGRSTPWRATLKADTKSAMRKRLDVILDKLNDRDLSILEATAITLSLSE